MERVPQQNKGQSYFMSIFVVLFGPPNKSIKNDLPNRNDSSKTKNRSQYQGSKDTQTGSMIEQLTEGMYECTVCCETVRCDSPIWSCQECYNVFHMRCIKKWAKSPAAAAEGKEFIFRLV